MKTTINYQQELGDIESPKQKAQRIALEEKISTHLQTINNNHLTTIHYDTRKTTRPGSSRY